MTCAPPCGGVARRRIRGTMAGVVLLPLLFGGCVTSRAPAPEEEGDFADFYSAGLDALDRTAMDEAERAFKFAIQKNSRHPYPHFYMGVIYVEKGEIDLAAVAFKQAVELEPNFPEALFNLGTISLERREAATAVQLLEQSLTFDSEYVPTYNNLAKAYFLAGHAEMAGAAYEEALARDPENEVALQGLIALARGAGAEEAERLYRSRLGGGS